MKQPAMELVLRAGMGVFSRAIKRLVDIIFSLIGLVLLSPAFIVVFFMLKRQGDGPIIFKQERIGYKGKPVYILKFRTMKMDSENGTPVLAKKGDDRLTPVGKFLREHHLDELPQLFNVLKGEMSFVGPRPERQFFIDLIKEHNPNYDYIYLMRPGLTSHATMYNGYTDTIEKMLIRLQMDLDYLQNRSLWLDLKIIVKTALMIIFGKKF